MGIKMGRRFHKNMVTFEYFLSFRVKHGLAFCGHKFDISFPEPSPDIVPKDDAKASGCSWRLVSCAQGTKLQLKPTHATFIYDPSLQPPCSWLEQIPQHGTIYIKQPLPGHIFRRDVLFQTGCLNASDNLLQQLSTADPIPANARTPRVVVRRVQQLLRENPNYALFAYLQHACEECEKCFRSPNALISHMSRRHQKG